MFERKYRCNECNRETVVRQKRGGGARRKICWACQRGSLVLVAQSSTDTGITFVVASTPAVVVRSTKKRLTLRTRFGIYRGGAAKRGLPFTLTLSTFSILLNNKCHYCGISPTISEMGIDRKDNNIGYVASNCLSACRHCNYAKGKLSYDVFSKEMAARRSYFNSLNSGATVGSGATVVA